MAAENLTSDRTIWEEIGFFFQGFISSCFSRSFYQEVVKKPLIFAIGFFLVFGLFIAGVTTVTFFREMGSLGEEIRSAYQSGEFPEIIIENGVATVNGPQPIEFNQGRQFFGIDTRGTINEIDTLSYSEGFLLTRTELHVLNENGYERLRLRDLNATFGDPLVVDEENVLRWLGVFSTFFAFIAFIGVFFGNTFFWFMINLLLGLLIWGIVTTRRKDIGFSLVMSVGLFAYVPATYIDFVLNKLGLQFCGMHFILMIVLWAIFVDDVIKNQDSLVDLVPPG